MDERRVPLAVRSHTRPEEVGALIDEFRPDVVAIDSPPRWAATGRSRRTERELAACNIQSFNTPSEIHGRGNAFFAWMEVGFGVFRIAAEHGFPTYGGGSPKRRAMEVFPHATAVVLAGSLPPKGVSKRAWREGVLHAQGVRTDELTSIDRIDAALAALTGLLALDGRRFAPGDPTEGVIMLPVSTLPATPFRRAANAPSAVAHCSITVPAATRSARPWCAGSSPQGTTRSVRRCSGGGRARAGQRSTSSRSEDGSYLRRCGRRPALRDARHPCRSGTRSALRLGERPDLPDRDVRARRGRPAEALGLRTRREPDARGLPGGARGARRRGERVRVRERHGGGDHAAAHAAARRSRDLGERRVRRDIPSARERPVGLGTVVVDRRSGGRRGPPGCDPSHHQARVGRDTVEPDVEDRRSRRGRRRRARGRSARRGGQHVRDAGAAASARTRRRCRRPQRDEIPRRALRSDRRGDRHE